MQRRDHPARILRETETNGHMARTMFDVSAKILEEYEKKHDVVFEALDVMTLAEVKRLYRELSKLQMIDENAPSVAADLMDELRDLLGLDEESV